MMESRSATAAMWPVFLPMDSHSCAATACRSPIGEYFLKITSPSFSVYFKAGSTFVVQKGNPNKVDSSNLCGVKVAVQTGTTQEEEVNKDNEQCKADGKDAIDIQSSKLQTDVQNIAYPRQIAMYLCREMADFSYPRIGEFFGGRDHTTVIHAYEKIVKKI